MNEQLKPCPCCSSNDVVISNTATGNYRASCANCRMSTAGWHNHSEALNAWNTRADGWIYIDNDNPVMPEVQQKVIVFTWYGTVTEMTYRSNVYAATEKGKIPRFEWNGKISPWEIIAWMPLPAPPKAVK